MSNITPEKREYFEQKFLRQLKYDGMALRQHSVEEAHKETFRWIFDKDREQRGQWDNFQEWLDSPQQQLYWVTGKPGAGKSTLMKLLCDAITEVDPNGPHFDLGSEEGRPTVASFFFWAAGGPEMQRSIEGLFRTLTHQLLSQHPELIATVSPDRWQELCLFGDDPTSFTELELQKLLCKCVQALSNNRVWLFIDGLDEFSGKHDDLTQFLVELMSTCAVKICLASRPWEVFEEAFQNRPSLRIHELTHWDMKSYLLSGLRRSQHFITLEEEEPYETQGFLIRTLEKAQGVFMWIKIVAGCVRESLRAGESIEELHKLLDNLPDTSLDDLFHRILQDLEPYDLERAAKYIGFRKAHDAIELLQGTPMRATTFSFADEMDPEYSISLPVKMLQPPEFYARLLRIKRKVNSSCKGLLEFAELSETENGPFSKAVIVQYPHRSVKDYLDSPRAHTIMSKVTVTSPHLRLCAAHLVSVKTEPYDGKLSVQVARRMRDFDVAYCLSHAAMVSPQHSSTMITVLDDLQTLSLLKSDDSVANWERVFTSVLMPNDLTRTLGGFGFLSIAVLCKVFEYVKHDIMRRGHIPWRRRLSLWKNRVRRIYRSESTWLSEMDDLLHIAVGSKEPHEAMIELLLRSGANPNSMRYKGSQKAGPSVPRADVSPWEWVLLSLIVHSPKDAEHLSLQELWARIGRLLVVYGARLNDRSIANALKELRSRGYICYLDGGEGRLIKTIKESLLASVFKRTTKGPSKLVIKWGIDYQPNWTEDFLDDNTYLRTYLGMKNRRSRHNTT